MLRFITIITATFLLAAANISAQQLKGFIRNSEGENIPSVTIYIKESMTGTSSNDNGEYQIRLQEGVNHIIFQSLGYQSTEVEIMGSTTAITKDITMTRRPVAIKEVRVYPGSEDAAYPIMRKAIASAPMHLKEVSAFESEVYLKGTLNFKKMPRIVAKHIEVNGQKIKAGDIFSMESLNEISFESPDKYNHKVVSMRSTFPSGTGQEDEYIGYISNSFYQPTIGIAISPLSPSAFSHYRFVYEEFFVEQGMEINRIRVIPKRKSQQLFSGYINIVDKTWAIQSVDLVNEAFFGKLTVKQTFAPVKGDAWLPVNHNFTVEASGMGVKIDGFYIGSVKYKSVTLSNQNKNISDNSTASVKNEDSSTLSAKEKKSADNMQKIKELMDKPNLKQSDMTKVVKLMEKQQRLDDTTSNKRIITDNYKVTREKDTLLKTSDDWDMIRPVPLSADELRTFKSRDSIMLTLKKIERDSIVPKKKRNIGFTIMFGSSEYNNFKKKFSINNNGLLNPSSASFHPVTGFNYKQTLGARYRPDSIRTITINTMAGYSFSAEKISWSANVSVGNSEKGSFGMSAGHFYSDMKGDQGINNIVNSIYNLVLKDNYKILTRQQSYSFFATRKLADGLMLLASVRHDHFIEQQNYSNYSFFNRGKNYDPNIPVNGKIDDAHLTSSLQASLSVGLRYTPFMKCRISGGRRIPAGSDYPTLGINYRQGIKSLWNSGSSYSHINGTIEQKREWGIFNSFNWKIDAGIFINADDIHFTQWKHFGGNDAPVDISDGNRSFVAAKPYQLSVNSRYVSVSASYGSPLLVLKYLPGLSNTLWSEDLTVNHVSTPNICYTEAGYGLSRIFMVARAGVFTYFNKAKYEGVVFRIAVGF